APWCCCRARCSSASAASTRATGCMPRTWTCAGARARRARPLPWPTTSACCTCAGCPRAPAPASSNGTSTAACGATSASSRPPAAAPSPAPPSSSPSSSASPSRCFGEFFSHRFHRLKRMKSEEPGVVASRRESDPFLICGICGQKKSPVAVDLVADVLGGGGGGGGVDVAGRGVEDGAGGADHEAGAVGAPGVLHHGLDVAALGADARDQEGQVADDRAHLVQLLRPGRADDQHAVAVRVPLACDRLGHVLVQRQAVGGDDVLEVGGAGVRGP